MTIADVEMTTHQRFHGNRFGSHEATQSPGGSCEGRQVADIRICRDVGASFRRLPRRPAQPTTALVIETGQRSRRVNRPYYQ